MFELILQVLGAGLGLWQSKEKNKYVDKLIELKKRYYEEQNKPYDKRSAAVLDNLEFELRLIAIGFATSTGTKNSLDIP